MATRITCLAKNNLFMFHKSFSKQLTLNVSRFLYSASSLGLDGYIHTREYIKNQFQSVEDNFREKMLELVNPEAKNKIIFTEDLKNMIHLFERNQTDLDLLCKMIEKYHYNNTIRAGSFIFGTIVMRALHYLGEPVLAFELIRNPELSGFFNQISSYHVLMDCLYEHGRYEEAKILYEDLTHKCINGIVHPKNPFIILLASCYKQNTPESYEYAQNSFRDFQSRGYKFPRRAIEFMAALALRQNDPENALEILSLCISKTYIDIRCLQLECYVALNRIDKISLLFHMGLQNDGSNKTTFFKDCIANVEKYIEDQHLDSTHNLVQQLNLVKSNGLIQDINLFDHICSTINMTKFNNKSEPKLNDGSSTPRYKYDAL